MATQHPSPTPTPCPTLSPTKGPPHPSAAPQEPKLQPEKRPIPSPLETGTPGTVTAASLYLHDDVESQIQQQVTDKDPQYVGGEVSGPIQQPKDSTKRGGRRDIRQALLLGTRYIPKLTATHCPTRPQDAATLPQLPNSLEETHHSPLLSAEQTQPWSAAEHNWRPQKTGKGPELLPTHSQCISLGRSWPQTCTFSRRHIPEKQL